MKPYWLKLEMPPVWGGLKIEVEEHRDGMGQAYEEVLAMRDSNGTFVSGDRRIICSVAHTAWMVYSRHRGSTVKDFNDACKKADAWLTAIEDKA